MVHSQRWGSTIMASPEKQLVNFPDRDRPVVTENDLETNYELLKELTFACFEHSLKGTSKHEIPVLADFEAGYINTFFTLRYLTWCFLCHFLYSTPVENSKLKCRGRCCCFPYASISMWIIITEEEGNP